MDYNFSILCVLVCREIRTVWRGLPKFNKVLGSGLPYYLGMTNSRWKITDDTEIPFSSLNRKKWNSFADNQMSLGRKEPSQCQWTGCHTPWNFFIYKWKFANVSACKTWIIDCISFYHILATPATKASTRHKMTYLAYSLGLAPSKKSDVSHAKKIWTLLKCISLKNYPFHKSSLTWFRDCSQVPKLSLIKSQNEQ